MSESLNDILSRVLGNVTDAVATKAQNVAVGRRPLLDPDANSVGFYNELQSTIRNIHDPRLAMGLTASLERQNQNQPGNQIGGDGSAHESGAEDSSSSPAVRKTTIGDDLNVIGTIANAGTDIARDLGAAGKAAQTMVESSGKLDRAIVELTRSVVKATPGTAAAQSAGHAGGILGKTGDFLNSNSIAESVRAMVGKLRNGGMNGGGLVSSSNSSSGSLDDSALMSRLSSGFDRILARSVLYFKSLGMTYQSGRDDTGEDDGASESRQSNSGSFSSGRSIVQSIGRRIGRAGRRSIIRAFRGRVVRGMRAVRAGGGGAAGGGWAGMRNAIPPGGGMAGAGGMGGGAAAGGAGAGGAAAGGGAGLAVAAGVLAAGVALIAVIVAAGKAIHSLGTQGFETAMRLSQYNGELNIAKAQLNVGRLMRDIQTAQDLGKAGAEYAKTINRLEETMRPLTDGAMKVSLELLTVVVSTLTTGFQYLLKATLGVVKTFDEIEKNFGKDFIPEALIKRLEDAANGGNKNQPKPDFLGLHDEFAKRAIPLPPRGPIPPMGGAKP